jgi:hypothetical protein
MSQSQVPIAPNLDILTEIVTDTGAAAPSATAQMQAILAELALIRRAPGLSPPLFCYEKLRACTLKNRKAHVGA